MPIMISLGKEFLHICPKDANKLEYSTNAGRTWMLRFNGNTNVGMFQDLIMNGKELLATTDKGLFYSINSGRSWNKRH